MDFEHVLNNLNAVGVDPLDFHKRLESQLQAEGRLPPHRSVSRVGLRGCLSIYRINDDGSRWLLHSDWNLVTNIGFQTLAAMWGEPDSPSTFDDAKPALIGIGAQSQPTAPLVTDTQLQEEVDRGVFDQRTFTGSPTNGVQFERTILKGNSAANNRTITEAGLFRADDAPANQGLIARQTFTGIPKNDTFQLLFRWQFSFTEA
jgi:hypothetical protein